MPEPLFFDQPCNRSLFARQRCKKRQSRIDRPGEIPAALSRGLCSTDDRVLPSDKFGFGIHLDLSGDVFESHGKMGAFSGCLQEVRGEARKRREKESCQRYEPHGSSQRMKGAYPEGFAPKD